MIFRLLSSLLLDSKESIFSTKSDLLSLSLKISTLFTSICSCSKSCISSCSFSSISDSFRYQKISINSIIGLLSCPTNNDLSEHSIHNLSTGSFSSFKIKLISKTGTI